jgi:general secretion pathway protein H
MVRQAKGVTLVELLVVMALASILLAIVFPAVGSGLGTLELRSAARKLAAAARYAHDQAVYRRKTYQLEIDGGAGAIGVADLEGKDARRFELPGSVRIEILTPGDGVGNSQERRYFFLADGAAPSFNVRLANSRRSLLVESDPLTGAARVRE